MEFIEMPRAEATGGAVLPCSLSGSQSPENQQQRSLFLHLFPTINKALFHFLPLSACLLDSPATILKSPCTLRVSFLPLSFYLLSVSLYHFNLQRTQWFSNFTAC